MTLSPSSVGGEAGPGPSLRTPSLNGAGRNSDHQGAGGEGSPRIKSLRGQKGGDARGTCRNDVDRHTYVPGLEGQRRGYDSICLPFLVVVFKRTFSILWSV